MLVTKRMARHQWRLLRQHRRSERFRAPRWSTAASSHDTAGRTVAQDAGRGAVAVPDPVSRARSNSRAASATCMMPRQAGIGAPSWPSTLPGRSGWSSGLPPSRGSGGTGCLLMVGTWSTTTKGELAFLQVCRNEAFGLSPVDDNSPSEPALTFPPIADLWRRVAPFAVDVVLLVLPVGTPFCRYWHFRIKTRPDALLQAVSRFKWHPGRGPRLLYVQSETTTSRQLRVR